MADGIVEILKRYPGAAVGLTWNGGIARTLNAFRLARSTHIDYATDPENYAPTRRDTEPVNPKPHFQVLLGWK